MWQPSDRTDLNLSGIALRRLRRLKGLNVALKAFQEAKAYVLKAGLADAAGSSMTPAQKPWSLVQATEPYGNEAEPHAARPGGLAGEKVLQRSERQNEALESTEEATSLKSGIVSRFRHQAT